MGDNKIIVVPDVHGRDCWKEAASRLEFGEVDKVVFIGDYFDSFYIDGKTQIENFKEIVEFKKNNPDNVILLTGNHDIQYITDHTCSGYQAGKHYVIKNLLDPLRMNGGLKMVHIEDPYLFVHAGVGKYWCDKYNIDMNNIEESINDVFKKTPSAFDFQYPPENKHMLSEISYYGDNYWQSPTWIRPQSLEVEKIDGFIQVVGHTRVPEPTFKDGLWFIDCHDTKSQEFLILPK